MQVDRSRRNDSRPQRVYEMECCIEALNARIARLAIGLGVSLRNQADVALLMALSQEAVVTKERRLAPDRRRTPRPGPDRRRADRREELRGLLVLRYGVWQRYIEEVGVIATRQILFSSEVLMVRRGFEPGAAGID